VKPLLTVATLVAMLLGPIVGNLRAEITAEQVRNSIDLGVKYLKSRQRRNGGWINSTQYPGGITALCTLALLNSGVEPSDECIQNALNYLRKIPPEKTYVVALQTMVFARAEPEKDLLLIRRNVKWLENAQLRKMGPRSGAWTYSDQSIGDGDNSNSQFALLALHEAEMVGVSANDQTWNLAKTYWENCQNLADGSWGYSGSNPNGTGSMTCAGISALLIAYDRVQASDAKVVGNRIECCLPRDATKTDRIERGLQWLGQNYSVRENPRGGGAHLLYYLYGLERVGRLSSRRFLPLPAQPGQPDRADWYREGAEVLVKHQDRLDEGFWRGVGYDEGTAEIGTSFALLFLSKGRWPVLLAKLQHSPADDWNSHRSDVANLTRYVERKWKRDMTSQVIDLRLATIDDLGQTQVLYLCGSQDPVPEGDAKRKELAQKIRGYLDRSGFLFAEGYGDGKGFDAGFRALMKEVFPEPEYKLRLLDAEHPIWHAEEKVDPSQLRPIWGIEFGCRTSVVYVPADPPGDPRPSLSCLWELSRPGRGEKYPRQIQTQIDAGLSLGINVLAYATNRELQPNDIQPRKPRAQAANSRVERGRVYVATLRHPGGCNAAPRAIVNLMDSAASELKIRTQVREGTLSLLDDSLFDYHLVFMHGRTTFCLTDAEREQLRQYVERGGMLFADSICASLAFTESFRREMETIFPKNKLVPMPANDPLLTKAYGGFDLPIVSRRDPATGRARDGRLEATINKVPPALEGIKFGDRWGVVFSQFDLSCALEKRDSLECRGYTREDAARIGLNVILYSLQH
jgi:hypothetical protein